MTKRLAIKDKIKVDDQNSGKFNSLSSLLKIRKTLFDSGSALVVATERAQWAYRFAEWFTSNYSIPLGSRRLLPFVTWATRSRISNQASGSSPPLAYFHFHCGPAALHHTLFTLQTVRRWLAEVRRPLLLIEVSVFSSPSRLIQLELIHIQMYMIVVH